MEIGYKPIAPRVRLALPLRPCYNPLAPTMKPIAYTKHARVQMQLRAVSESEVVETIRRPERTALGKRGAVKLFRAFPFNAEHASVYYRFKSVEVRYVMKPDVVLVLTVISRFFN